MDWAVAKNKYMSHVIQKEDEKRFLANDVKIESESEDENEDKKPVIKMDDVEVKKESDSEGN